MKHLEHNTTYNSLKGMINHLSCIFSYRLYINEWHMTSVTKQTSVNKVKFNLHHYVFIFTVNHFAQANKCGLVTFNIIIITL